MNVLSKTVIVWLGIGDGQSMNCSIVMVTDSRALSAARSSADLSAVRNAGPSCTSWACAFRSSRYPLRVLTISCAVLRALLAALFAIDTSSTRSEAQTSPINRSRQELRKPERTPL